MLHIQQSIHGVAQYTFASLHPDMLVYLYFNPRHVVIAAFITETETLQGGEAVLSNNELMVFKVRFCIVFAFIGVDKQC